jgi:hypothetical protein
MFSAFTCGSTSSVAHNRAFMFPVVLSPCRGGELERVHDLESQAGGSVATGWASLAGQVNGETLGLRPTTGKYPYHCLQVSTTKQAGRIPAGRLKMRKRIMRIATWSVQSINKLKEVEEL